MTCIFPCLGGILVCVHYWVASGLLQQYAKTTNKTLCGLNLGTDLEILNIPFNIIWSSPEQHKEVKKICTC